MAHHFAYVMALILVWILRRKMCDMANGVYLVLGALPQIFNRQMSGSDGRQDHH